MNLACLSHVHIRTFKKTRQVQIQFSCVQSYKASTIVIYHSRVGPNLTPYYDSRLVNYERKLFIRLATVLSNRVEVGITALTSLSYH